MATVCPICLTEVVCVIIWVILLQMLKKVVAVVSAHPNPKHGVPVVA